MHPWVAIPGLILLLTNGVMSYVKVVGMVGQPVVLPCTYTGKAATMCWGRGPCPWSRCTAEMIWTNGYSVTYQQSPRYSLKGNIRSGNVSLTIDNPTVQDSGLYCCRIERKGWFNDRKLTISLEIKPAPLRATIKTVTTWPTTTTKTTRPTITTKRTWPTVTTKRTWPTVTTKRTWPTVTTKRTRPTTTAHPKPGPTKKPQPGPPTRPPMTATTTWANTTARPKPRPTKKPQPDGNDTVTKSSGALQPNNQSPAVTVQSPWRTNNKGIYIGLCIAAIVLLVTILIVLLVRKYLCLGGKVELLRMISFKDSHFGALKNAAVKHVRAEDNVYIIEDSQ
nr:hepatitis A virus cellular receptor 1 [Camelus dromedarius]